MTTFIAVGGASAALTGLVFVAMSLPLSGSDLDGRDSRLHDLGRLAADHGCLGASRSRSKGRRAEPVSEGLSARIASCDLARDRLRALGMAGARRRRLAAFAAEGPGVHRRPRRLVLYSESRLSARAVVHENPPISTGLAVKLAVKLRGAPQNLAELTTLAVN